MNIIFLIDCNNFFASCETVFRPEYKNKPLVVASGKNGIVIARSKEARALGIPMGAASFAYRSLFNKEDVIACHTNFALYTDISKRIRKIVKAFGFKTFVYSIDEMFLQVPKSHNLDALAKEIQQKIKTHVDIDVSIGISKTKTLAKVATKLAKKTTINRKSLLDQDEINQALQTFPVKDVWGIGRKTAKKLDALKIRSASSLLQMNETYVAKLLSVCGQRIYRELLGENSYPFFHNDPDKSMQITKTFPQEIYSINRIKEILCDFATNGCYKLRKKQKEASMISLFLQSSRFKEKKNFFYKEFVLDEPSNYTPDFLSFIDHSLSSFIDGEIEIKRAGIAFSLMTDSACSQKNLFNKNKPSKKDLLSSVDEINELFGKNTIFFGSVNPEKETFKKISNRYTTNWNEILEIEI